MIDAVEEERRGDEQNENEVKNEIIELVMILVI